MKGGETFGGIVIVIAVVVFMWRRGEGWRRMLAGAFIPWAVSSVFIVLWELVFAFALRGSVMLQPTGAPIAEAPSPRDEPPDWEKNLDAYATSVAERRRSERESHPVTPQTHFPVGTEFLVSSDIPLWAGPDLKARFVEWATTGQRLVITGDYALQEQGWSKDPLVYWPVTNQDSGAKGYVWDVFLRMDVTSGTND